MLAASLYMGGWWRGHNDSNQQWSVRWAARDLSDTQAIAKREATEREEEQRRKSAVNQVIADAQQQINSAKTDADNAQRSGDRLQQQLKELQHQLAGSETGRLAAITAGSQARGEVTILLTQLLSESDKAARDYAAEADKNYAEGMTCERIYDSVSKK